MDIPSLEHGLVWKIIERLESAPELRKIFAVSKTLRILSRDLIMQSVDVTLLMSDCPRAKLKDGIFVCFDDLYGSSRFPAFRQIWRLSLWPKISTLPKVLGDQKEQNTFGTSQFERTVAMSEFVGSQEELLAFCYDFAIKLNVSLHAPDSFWEAVCNNDSGAAFVSTLTELEIIFKRSELRSGTYENALSRARCLKQIVLRYPFQEVQNSTIVRRSRYDPISVSVFQDVCCGIRLSQFLEKLHLSLPGLFAERGGVDNLAHCLRGTTRLQDLDLSGNGFGDGVFVIADCLTALARLSALNLSHNGISADGSLYIAKALSNLSNLTALDLRNNRLGPREMRNVCSQLKVCRLSTLNRIDCESWFNGTLSQFSRFPTSNSASRFSAELRQERPGAVDDWSDFQESANLIGALLPRSASVLTSMVLDCCDNSMLISLALAFDYLTSLTTLEFHYIKLASFNDREELLVLLADGLKNLVSLQRLRLTTFYNDDDKGLTALAHNLKFFTQLHSLDLSGSNMQDLGCTAISDYLVHITCLQTLLLEKNRIGPKGATSLCEALKSHTGLTKLNMGKNPLSSEGGTALAELLPFLPKLQTLVVYSADLRDEALQAIGDRLQRFPCFLQDLILADNLLTPRVGEILCCALMVLTSLKGLDLSLNDMHGATGVAFSECLAMLTCLEYLHLYSVSLSDHGAVAIVSSLSRLVKLKALTLGGGTLKGTESATLELPNALIPLLELKSLNLSFNRIALNVWRKIIELLFGPSALHSVQVINEFQCDKVLHGGLDSFSLKDAGGFAEDCFPLLACLLPRSSETLTNLDLSSFGWSMGGNIEAIVECIHRLSILQSLDLSGTNDHLFESGTWTDCISTIAISLPNMLRELRICMFCLEDICIMLSALDICPALTIINHINCRAILQDISASSFEWDAENDVYACREDPGKRFFCIERDEENLLCALLYTHGTALKELRLSCLKEKIFLKCLSRLTSLCLLELRSLSWEYQDFETLAIGLAALPSLSQLSLQNAHLLADGAAVIANTLADKSSLTSLDLSYNNLGFSRQNDFETLAVGLAALQYLSHLSLRSVGLKAEREASVTCRGNSNTLQTLETPQHNPLPRHPLSPATRSSGQDERGTVLAPPPCLKVNGATVLANALTNNHSLSTLDLSHNGLGEADIATFEAILSGCEVFY